MIIEHEGWRLFDSDIQAGRYVWVRTNPDGSQTFRTDYHVDQTIDTNTAQRNLAQPGWAGDYHHVASIPLNVFHDQLAEASRQNDQQYISKWLNDADHRAWRTKEGRV